MKFFFWGVEGVTLNSKENKLVKKGLVPVFSQIIGFKSQVKDYTIQFSIKFRKGKVLNNITNICKVFFFLAGDITLNGLHGPCFSQNAMSMVIYLRLEIAYGLYQI